MLKTKIVDCLKQVIKESVPIEIFVPETEKFGHYSTNVALRLAKLQGKNSMEIAETIASGVKHQASGIFEKIEVAAPGFINFWLSEKALQGELKEILTKKNNYGAGLKKKEKISLDYLDANPTGPIHLGHARSGFLGDTLANILEFFGYKVSREFYVNNAKNSAQIQSLGRTALRRGDEYKHAKLLQLIENPAVRKKLGVFKDEKEAGFYIAGLIQKENEKFLKEKAKIKFDLFFEEEKIYSSRLVEKTRERLEAAGATYKKDGAVWLKAKEYGDSEDRVLIRGNGEPTYLLPDIGYHWDRLVKRKYSRAINIWGADHFGYGPRLKAAFAALGVNASKIFIIITQIARLIKEGKEIKMSKRTGEFITLEELIEEVGLDATRFFFLMNSPDTHMDFDLDLAKEQSLKNPVYYAQYAFVRAQSILTKANPKSKILNSKQAQSTKSKILNLLNTKEDINLMRTLIRFPEIIEEAAENYNPQALIRYALDLAKEFHNFYEKERIIGEKKELMLVRLELIKAARIIFKNLFELLGISLPQRM